MWDKMPRKGQASVTIPKWVWNLANEYYEENKDELARQGVKSTTALIKLWIIEKSRK